jgi:hypothetical protein
MNRIGSRASIKLAAAVLAVCAVGLAIALPAMGHKVTYSTSLQLKSDQLNDTTEQYSGKVNSTKGACKSGRTITIAQSGTPIATTVSSVSGDWAVTAPVPPKGTSVTASTPKKILKKNRKHVHKCGPASVTHRVN